MLVKLPRLSNGAGQTTPRQLASGALGEANLVEINGAKIFALCLQKPGCTISVRNDSFARWGHCPRGNAQPGICWMGRRSVEVVSGSRSRGSTKRIIHVNSHLE